MLKTSYELLDLNLVYVKKTWSLPNALIYRACKGLFKTFVTRLGGRLLFKNMAKCEIGNKPTSDVSPKMIFFKIRVRIDLQFVISPVY